MRDLMKAGSLDDETGVAQTRVILLKAPQTSLESLGTLAESAALYQRSILMKSLGDYLGAQD